MAAEILFCDFGTEPGRQMPQQPKLALTNHALRLFHHHAEETVYFAIVAREWTVGESMVGFLRVAATLQE